MSDAILSEGSSSESSSIATAEFDPAAIPVSTFEKPSWASNSTLGEDILGEPVFKNLKSMDDVIKSYYHASKLVGADKIVIPNKSSTPEQWKEYFIKAGLPASMDEYKAELPPSMDNPEFNKSLVAKAYELNIKPDQLSAVTAELEKYNEQIVAEYEETQKQQVVQTADSLKREWGGDYQRNLMQVQKTIEHFGGKELLTSVLNSPLASDGNFLRLINNISAKLNKEDTFVQDVVQTFGMDKSEARKKVNAIFGDPNHAYFDSNNAKHKDAVAEMLRYQEIISRQA